MVAMARAHRVAIYASAFLVIYLLAFFAVLPVPFLEPHVVAQLLPVVRNFFIFFRWPSTSRLCAREIETMYHTPFPWWLLVSFGAYSLASLGWGLFSFQDCPDAYQELLKEINEAKNDLRVRGVTVD